MHLRVCSAPAGTLASAPMTAMWTGPDHERLEAFWGEDDLYYVRRQRAEGESFEWFCFEELDGDAELAVLAEATRPDEVLRSTEDQTLRSDALDSALPARLVLGGRSNRRARQMAFAWVAKRRRRT